MFIRDQVPLDVVFEVARDRLGELDSWFLTASDHAYGEGIAGLARTGPAGAGAGPQPGYRPTGRGAGGGCPHPASSRGRARPVLAPTALNQHSREEADRDVRSQDREAPRIVVGVDGSASSLAALRWAVHQAELTGGTVDAVVAWQMPATMTGIGFALVAVTDRSDMEQTAQRVLDQVVSKVATAEGGPAMRRLAVQGFPAPVLLGASASADLLVLGSRGLGGFSGALLDSVGQHCVRHARCPVVIIRGDLARAA